MPARRPGVPGAASLVLVEDPLTGEQAELRVVQPYRAVKAYVCPGCNQEIAPGTGHVVIVPLRSAGERRHWHRSCWERRESRRPGR